MPERPASRRIDRDLESGLYHLEDDGSVTPCNGDTHPAEGAPKKHVRLSRVPDPTTAWGLAYRVLQNAGFNALLVLVLLSAGGYAGWKMLGWIREDQRQFLEAVDRNTAAIHDLAVELRVHIAEEEDRRHPP
jgi:hypothetical protein